MTSENNLNFEKLTTKHVFKLSFDQRASALNLLMGSLQGHFDILKNDKITKEELHKLIVWACENAKA